MDAVRETRSKRHYRDCYGNRALLDIGPRGIVLVAHLGGRCDVQHYKTVSGALSGMRTLTGSTWTEV